MGRTAAKVTTDFLRSKVEKVMGDDPCELRDAVSDDLKVRFDWENFNFHHYSGCMDPFIGYCTLGNGFTFLGCSSGGDWEYPVWFCIYWDGKKLRAYVPTDGNPFNTDTMTAYGSSSTLEEDRKNLLKRNPDFDPSSNGWTEDDWDAAEVCDRDYDALLRDVMERIKVRV